MIGKWPWRLNRFFFALCCGCVGARAVSRVVSFCAGLLTAAVAQQAFVAAFADVVMPITLTSLTNLCMFAILATAALPAIYLTATTAVLAVFLLYATVLTSFAAAMALDFQRQVNRRRDGLCCFAVPGAPATTANVAGTVDADADAESGSAPAAAATAAPAAAATAGLKQLLWAGLYRPLLASPVGRAAVLGAAGVLLVLASVGLANVQLGLGLTEFFPPGTQVQRGTRTQNQRSPYKNDSLNTICPSAQSDF